MTISQTLGPDAIAKHIDMGEYIKRLAAAQGIDYLNLVKSQDQMMQEKQAAMAEQQQMSLTSQAGQLAKAPMLDPSKSEGAEEMMGQMMAPPEQPIE